MRRIKNETNEQLIARTEIKAALAGLMRVVNKNHAALTGFVWGVDPPMIIRFGNVTEQGPDFTAMLVKLGDIAEQVVEKRGAHTERI